MYSNLRQKLKQMSSNHPQGKDIEEKKERKISRGNLGGEIIQSEWGEYVIKRVLFPLDSYYGSVLLSDIVMLQDKPITPFVNLEAEHFDKDSIVFLDTETTGLSGGTGTLAFLIGIGFFYKDHFIIEQYIARDYDEELAVLYGVSNRLSNYKFLISFNGKSYDWPLLEARFLLNRIPPRNWNGSHIDLLHPSRRMWKNKLDSCSLTALEINILDKSRKNDIPGEFIPSAYFKYLRERDPRQMMQIMEHNRQDILAMVALLIYLSKMYLECKSIKLDVYEIFSMAKFFEEKNDVEKSILFYKRCINLAKDVWISSEAKKRLAYLYKKRKQFSEAVDLWSLMADEEGSLVIAPLIEMAKYYEHVSKEYEKALDNTNRALEVATKYNRSLFWNEKIQEIQYRKKRLIKKIERKREDVVNR